MATPKRKVSSTLPADLLELLDRDARMRGGTAILAAESSALPRTGARSAALTLEGWRQFADRFTGTMTAGIDPSSDPFSTALSTLPYVTGWDEPKDGLKGAWLNRRKVVWHARVRDFQPALAA